MTAAIVNFEKILKELKKLPWRSIYFWSALSFVLATLAANLVSIKLMPDLTVANQPTSSTGESPGSEITASKPALTEAELKIIYDRNIFNKTGELGDVETNGEEGGITEEIRKTDLPVKL